MREKTPESVKNTARSRKAGQVFQGLVLGVMLVFATIGWVANYGNVAAFKYQGF